jgi:hypothetical protein
MAKAFRKSFKALLGPALKRTHDADGRLRVSSSIPLFCSPTLSSFLRVLGSLCRTALSKTAFATSIGHQQVDSHSLLLLCSYESPTKRLPHHATSTVPQRLGQDAAPCAEVATRRRTPAQSINCWSRDLVRAPRRRSGSGPSHRMQSSCTGPESGPASAAAIARGHESAVCCVLTGQAEVGFCGNYADCTSTPLLPPALSAFETREVQTA